MKLRSPGLIALIFVMAACGKEQSLEEPYRGNVCDYAPYSQGSVFEYEQTGVDTFNYTLRVAGDTSLDGEPYILLEDNVSGGFSLFKCGGGAYMQLVDVSSLPNAPQEPIKTVYLRDDLPRGGSWTEVLPLNIPGVGELPLTLRYTIVEKGAAKTVLGKSYTDVIGVQMDVSMPPLITPQVLSTSFFAKGIGLIQADREEDTTRLKAYTIR